MSVDYRRPIARANEPQYAAIIRNRSGMDSGKLDFALRDCTILPEQEQQEVVDTAFMLYEAMCRQLNRKSVLENSHE